jgi:hypothetical protein
MYSKIILLALLLIPKAMNLKAQNVIFIERSAENYLNYYDQIKLIEQSLEKGNLINKIVWAKETTSIQDFKSLSNKFNNNFPKLFYSVENGVPTIDSDKLLTEPKFIRWTYANLSKEKITVLVQLEVLFEVDNSEEKIYFPKVISFNVLEPSEMKNIDYSKLLGNFKQWQERVKDMPSPPPPTKSN